ncbi:2OG-Fe(II) oxygenase [Caballeronia grimmiae]|uniref:Prolyl 4-hydroxylase alpha subunit domain-containing protein n=1 Tax=Caballeronia grimmiae TaxID=1071679 RepID=A0A069P059_9BURK|nr:2OG-Fe(II) oxygenase [Caballeronia grimmiae]KDR33314.1 hypothetical protein BG57_08280 [Caballeronia grimmiae]GGD90338.1 hypothetical protein GCM10010985_51190 [Caballeronia grimmiae]
MTVTSETSPDFTQFHEHAFSPSECAVLIERFNQSEYKITGSAGGQIQQSVKRSTDLIISLHREWDDVNAFLNQRILQYLIQYIRSYPFVLNSNIRQAPTPGSGRTVLRDVAPLEFPSLTDQELIEAIDLFFMPGSINLQHYAANVGGYPAWHSEYHAQNLDGLHRALFWVVYLNEEFDEGETEFFFQRTKIKPRTGSLLIAPAGFTHTHRGNVPKNGDKYIATSWVMLKPAAALMNQAASAAQ